MTQRRALLIVLLLLGACGPRAKGRDKPRPEPPTATVREVTAPPKEVAGGAVVLEAADRSARCAFGYHGPVLDLGAENDAAFGAKLTPPPIERVERDGASWAAIHGKSLTVEFFVVATAADEVAGATPYVEARVRGESARSIALSLNGRPLGAAALTKAESRTIVLRGAAAQPVAGANELVVHFSGMPRGADSAAEIAWIHFGVGDVDPLYPAPTQRESIVNRSFATRAVRALSLRGPGFARCDTWLPAGGEVQSLVAIEGNGSADAEVRVVRDRAAPTLIGTLHVDASDPARARVHKWPLGDVGPAGAPGAVEVSVVRASKGARVLFGEPRVVATADGPVAPHAPHATASGVVLVIMSQLGQRALSIYGGSLVTPELSALSRSGVVFEANRASTGVSSGAVASMLTGRSARDVAVVDGDARLPKQVTTLADATRQAGITSAFFTANPLTSATFGFDRGWAHFEAHGPTDEGPASRVFDAAAGWLAEHAHAPFLVVIHARGGHPPWDVALDRVRTLPPEGYAGDLDARHAGELFGRAVRVPGYRFDDADRARAWALYGAAMEAEDAGLGRLVTQLRGRGVYDTTTLIVTGDVGVNDGARIPFLESEGLEEAALSTPLIVRFGQDGPAGVRTRAPTRGEDVASTVLRAFGLAPPVTFRGSDLRSVLDTGDGARESALAVDQDRFALRWDRFVFSGAHDHENKLCDLSLEATCVTDVRQSYPLASRLLHAELFRTLVTERPSFAREAVSIDASTMAALRVWGR